MLLPMVLNSVNSSLMETYVCELLESNEKTKEYGLELTVDEVKNIIEARNNILYGYGRLELGIEVSKELINNFFASPYINSENYVLTLNELHEIFYYLKNETEDKIADDKLIGIIRDCFEKPCGGSIELLKSTLEEFAKDFRLEAQMGSSSIEGDE